MGRGGGGPGFITGLSVKELTTLLLEMLNWFHCIAQLLRGTPHMPLTGKKNSRLELLQGTIIGKALKDS